jgi:DUF971 family protein
MCEFFSFNIARDGELYYLDGFRTENCEYDSHSNISKHYNLNDDEVWKYELPIDYAQAVEWELSNPSIEKVMEKLHYDGGLPEEEIPYSVVKRIKEQLINIVPKLAGFMRMDIKIDFEDDNASEVFTLDYEVTNETFYDYLHRKGFNNKHDKYWYTHNNGIYQVVYLRIQKPTKKILVYSYLHEYAKLQDGEPVKISEVRTVIKDVK